MRLGSYSVVHRVDGETYLHYEPSPITSEGLHWARLCDALLTEFGVTGCHYKDHKLVCCLDLTKDPTEFLCKVQEEVTALMDKAIEQRRIVKVLKMVEP